MVYFILYFCDIGELIIKNYYKLSFLNFYTLNKIMQIGHCNT